jgi:multidrug efflux pump subunit AcrA (membrane-fusion protein)
MVEQASHHPDPDQLAAFGRGSLDHHEMAEVESHLAACESCCQVLSTFPDDDFIGFLRAADERSDSGTSPSGAASQPATTPITFNASYPQAYSSQRGMVHRDIKPQNLMRTPDGQVKILDFGLARFASEALPDLLPDEPRADEPDSEEKTGGRGASITLTDMLLGTADYIAPEQATSPRSADIRADIYSLGCTLYYLLTGRPPFPYGSLIQKLRAHREQMPRSLTVARPDLPAELSRVVDRMMEKDRRLRIQRPAEVAEALAHFATGDAARDLAAEVEVTTTSEKRAVTAPSDLGEVLTDGDRLEPGYGRSNGRRQPGRKVALILAALVGCVGYIWLDAPGLSARGWPVGAWLVAAHLALLLGCAGFLWIGVGEWPGAARLALLIGCVGFIRMEAPGPHTAALLSLFAGLSWALGLITRDQFVSALVALLIGCVGFFWVGWGDLHPAGVLACVMACVVAVVIITFRRPTVRSWGYLTSVILVSAAAIAFALNHVVQIVVNGEGILLIENDILSLVRAQATGPLLVLRVKEGEHVHPGEEIGQISQEDLKDAVRGTESKLNDLQQEDRRLTELEKQDRKNDEALLARQLDALGRDSDDPAENARRSLRRTELEKDRLNAQNSRYRAQLERRVKVQSLETQLHLDREKLARMSQIITGVSGRVEQIFIGAGEPVREDAPVVLLHSLRAQPSADDSGKPPYDAIIFVAAGDGGRIDLGDFVEVVPATVKREEDGFIHGRVVAVEEQPATRRKVEETLGYPDLADAILKRHGPGNLLRVLVKLQIASSGSGRPADGRGNPFRWSSSHGFVKRLKSASPCQAAIVVQRRRLITLIFPWVRAFGGVDS